MQTLKEKSKNKRPGYRELKATSKTLNNISLASFIFFAICVIYLFPAFLGKVDTPTDIRDTRMYPWRYYSVDKKINIFTLWQSKFDEKNIVFDNEIKEKVFYFTTPQNTKRSILLDIFLDDSIVKNLAKITDSNYYVTFDFKPLYDASVKFSFGLSVINKVTKVPYTPGVAIVPIAQKDNIESKAPWYRTHFPLNNLISKLSSVNDLNQFYIEITAKNDSKESPASLYLREIKIVSEDFSKVTKAHNHYNNDLIQMFTPFREYFSNSLKKFKLPFWNNYIFGGHEFLAEPQIGYFHPLYFLLYFLFDHFTAHILLTFICLLLCGLGAYLLASLWGLGLSASVFTGVVYMFQPFNATWMSYEHMLMNSATLPFLFYFYEKSLKEKVFINKYMFFSSIFLGLLLVSGHLQYIYYSIIFFLMFVMYKVFLNLFSKNKDNLKIIFSAAFVFLFGFMLSAVVIIPFLELFENSHRTVNPQDLIKATSVPLKAFLGLFNPYYVGKPDWATSGIINRTPEYDEYRLGFMRNYVYFGLLPFLISIFSIKTVLKNKLTVFLFVSILISLLICTGSPFFFLIRDFLPGFKEMQHYRFLQIFSYSVPFLCGIGFQAFYDLFPKIGKNAVKYISFFVILISTIDLMYYSSFFVTWSDRKDYKPVHKDGVIEFILNEKRKSKEPFRILPFSSQKVEGTFLKGDSAEPNTLLPYEIEDASGYSSFIPKDYYYTLVYVQTMDSEKLYSGMIFDLFSNINTPYPISNFHSMILDLLNVKYFIVPNFLTLESDKVKKIFSGDSTVYENLDYLPRAFFVPNYKVIESSKETIIELDSDEFDPRIEVILMSFPTLDSRWSLLSAKAGGENDIQGYDIDFVMYDQNNITLNADVNHSGFLVLGHNLNNNWKVKINDEESKHFQANLIQRAVYLPEKGEYKIEFSYFPKLFLKGLLISLSSLFILFILLLFILLKPKSSLS